MAYLNDMTATTPVCWLCGGLLSAGVAHVCSTPVQAHSVFSDRCLTCGAFLSPNSLHICSAPRQQEIAVQFHDPMIEPLRQEVEELKARLDALEAALRAEE